MTNEIEAEIATTWQQIAGATGQRDLKAVEQLTEKATELSKLKEQAEAIKNRVRALKNGSQPAGASVGTLRELSVPVTQGMISKSLLTLAEAVKHGKIRIGDRLSIEALPSGDRFQTELLPSGKKLRERGKIAKFYRDAGCMLAM